MRAARTVTALAVLLLALSTGLSDAALLRNSDDSPDTALEAPSSEPAEVPEAEKLAPGDPVAIKALNSCIQQANEQNGMSSPYAAGCAIAHLTTTMKEKGRVQGPDECKGPRGCESAFQWMGEPGGAPSAACKEACEYYGVLVAGTAQ